LEFLLPPPPQLILAENAIMLITVVHNMNSGLCCV
jgi:hypothetical protein